MNGQDEKAASQEFLRLVPRDFAREHLILSEGKQEGTERLAIASTTDRVVTVDRKRRTRRPAMAMANIVRTGRADEPSSSSRIMS